MISKEEIINILDEHSYKAYPDGDVVGKIDFDDIADCIISKLKEPNNVSGTLLLSRLFEIANDKNEDGMPVIKVLDKPNGGTIPYIRYDAMVKELNNLLKTKL